jgi:hypothetical protein
MNPGNEKKAQSGKELHVIKGYDGRRGYLLATICRVYGVVQGACEKKSADKKIVVNDDHELTFSNIVSNMTVTPFSGLETVYQNEICVFSPMHFADKLVHFHRGGIMFSYEDCWNTTSSEALLGQHQ